METFFTNVEPPMPAVPEDGKIEAGPFLEAAKQIVPFFDSIGTAFIPVKNDIDGNVKKLQKKYESNPEKYKTFHAMLDEEIMMKQTKSGSSASISLLWLKRALQFMCEFFRLIIQDHKDGVNSENMGHHCRQAYEKHLKQYHGWIVQKIFSVVSRALPYRRDFLKALALGTEGMEAEVIAQMDDYLAPLQANMDAIQVLFDEKGLDYSDKV